MRKLVFLTTLLTILCVTWSFGQINQNSNPAAVGIDGFPIPKGEEGALDVIVENNGSDPMPAGTFRVSINIDATKMEFVDPASYITTDYPDWSIVSNAGGQLVLVNANGEISPSESIAFSIKVKVLAGATEGLAAVSVRVSIAPGKSSQAGNADNSTADDNGTGFVSITPPLPVTLISFTAIKESKTVLLGWATTEETNSDRFEIERSATGKVWDKIGSVTSHGESKSLRNYSFSDVTPLGGENLYRLRMVDKDETFAYSRIRNVNFEAPELFVYPNPSADLVYVPDYQNVQGVLVSDLKGNVVLHASEVRQQGISIRDLHEGLYMFRITRKNGTEKVQKVLVTK